MRPNHEILKVFLDNQHLFFTGLCMWNCALWQNRLLSTEERNLIDCLIMEEAKQKVYCHNSGPILYIWPEGKIHYRINFLKEKLV